MVIHLTDNIYDDKSNNFIQRLINKYLRYSMFNRYQLTIDKIKKHEKSENILDIGCGTGSIVLNLPN